LALSSSPIGVFNNSTVTVTIVVPLLTTIFAAVQSVVTLKYASLSLVITGVAILVLKSSPLFSIS
jgi:hypothetical protein